MIGEQKCGSIPGVVISAVSHQGLTVSFNGEPAQLAILNSLGELVAIGDEVAREAEAVAVNSYRNFLMGKGFLRVIGFPIRSRGEGPAATE